MTREGEPDLIPMRFDRSARGSEDATSEPDPGPRTVRADGLAAFRYDDLPAQYDSLLERPYQTSSEGITGERVALNLRGGYLDKFTRAALRGAPDSAAIAHTKPRQALVPLQALLRDPQYQVRASAVSALEAIGDPAALTAVRERLTDAHAMVRGQAESAVRTLASARR